ncbi:MAG: response regulator, partial [Bdellovibrionales bacterium]
SFIENKPDVMVTDIQMPGGGGCSLIEKIRSYEEKNWHIPILALTATSDSEELKKISESGFDAHLSKPIAANQLVDTIRKIAGKI